MVLGVGWPTAEWKFNEIYSVQCFVSYINNVYQHLLHKAKWGASAYFFPLFFSVLYENDVILDNVVQISGVIVKQVQFLYLIGDLCCR